MKEETAQRPRYALADIQQETKKKDEDNEYGSVGGLGKRPALARRAIVKKKKGSNTIAVRVRLMSFPLWTADIFALIDV